MLIRLQVWVEWTTNYEIRNAKCAIRNKYTQECSHDGGILLSIHFTIPNSQFSISLIIFAAYDTRTNQEYEGPCSRPEEVSLTSITGQTR